MQDFLAQANQRHQCQDGETNGFFYRRISWRTWKPAL